MDIADQAEQQETAQREAAIQAARRNTGTRIKHTGNCHSCHATIKEPKLFCNGECAKRYSIKTGR